MRQICDFLDSEIIDKPKGLNSYKELITYVKDRAGHDLCYGINAEKIKKDLNWKPEINFQSGIENTIKWYIKNKFLYIT